MNTQHPWMNTCIELTMAVYINRVWNFAGFKPKCKTDFLPWLHHSKFFMQTQYNFRGKSQAFKEINCYNNYDWIDKTANILFTHCFKTANTKLLPCSLRSDEVKHLVQILRIWQYCSQENNYFLVLFDPTLDKPVFCSSTCIEMLRKSHITEPSCY